MRSTARHVLHAAHFVLLAAACAGPEAPGGGIRFADADPAAFGGELRTPSNRVFDVVAADMDGDGDEDVLINWHHLAPLELFENLGGRFRLVGTSSGASSGLDDAHGVPVLFAAEADMRRRIEAAGERGLTVWHDLDRRGVWRFDWRSPDDGGRTLRIEAALGIDRLDGLLPADLSERAERTLVIELPAREDRVFSVGTEQVTVGLVLDLRRADGTPDSFVAGPLRAVLESPAEIWKPDPHGIAWVDVENDERPELYLTRGALMGRLPATAPGKRDRYYRPARARFYDLTPAAVVPPDRSRGRRVEWVDLDGDGTAELSIGAEASPNRLLVWERPEAGSSDVPGPASSRLVDRAADLNLDFHQGAVLAWGDHDADGWADAYLLGEHAVDVALRRGAGFEILPGTDVGLTLPETHQPAVTQFDFAALRLADLEGDGDLDLWLLSAGRDRSHRLFRREADGFVDVSDASGVTGVSGGIFAVLCDFDNDGDVDGLSDGRLAGEDPDGLPAGAGHAVLWHNHGGGRFDLERLPASVVPRPVHAATCLDADGDGVTDVAAVGPERYLLPNATAPAGGWIDVAPTDRGRPALGAEVRLTYSDGRVVVQRLGSARNSAFSQTVAALRFGVPRTARVVELSVRWPGEATPRRHPPPATGTVRVIERRTDPVQPPT